MDLTNSETTSQPGQPALTVVLPTIDNYQRIQKTLTHLQAQTARSEIEVLIVASSKGALKLDPAVAEGFFDLRVIEVGEIHSLAVAKSLAAAEARADWVVFGEDHSWPEPGWAKSPAMRWAKVMPKTNTSSSKPGDSKRSPRRIAMLWESSCRDQAAEHPEP